MAKKKKEEEKALVLTRDNLLYQPLSLAVNGYEASAFQQNIVIAMLRKLKKSIKQMKDAQFTYIHHGKDEEKERKAPKQLTLFETDDVSLYKQDDEVLSFSLHMRELGIEPRHYLRAFNEVCKVSDIDVWVPVKSADGKTEYERRKLFTVAVNEEDIELDEEHKVIGYKYQNHNPTVKLKLSRTIADVVFNPHSRIYDFIDDTAMMIAEKFPKRLYMYLSNSKYLEGGLTIGYWKFRKQIGFDDSDPSKIQYPRFYDFKKKVLDPSVETLKEMADKDLSDFWFEYEVIYEGSQRAKAPDKIHFTIHLSKVGNDIKNDKMGTPLAMELDSRLREEFEQTPLQVRKLFSLMQPEDFPYLRAKMDELSRYFETTKVKVKDKKAYTNKVLTEFLNYSKDTKEDVQNTENDNSNGSTVAKPIIIENPKLSVPALSNIAKEKWDNFCSYLHETLTYEEYNFWMSCMRLWSFENNKVNLILPSSFCVEILMNKFKTELAPSIFKAFGEGVGVGQRCDRDWFEAVVERDNSK